MTGPASRIARRFCSRNSAIRTSGPIGAAATRSPRSSPRSSRSARSGRCRTPCSSPATSRRTPPTPSTSRCASCSRRSTCRSTYSRETTTTAPRFAATSSFPAWTVSRCTTRPTSARLRLVVVDTTRPGENPGALDEEGLSWLDAELAAEPGTPTVIAMHHPPILTGIPPLDEIGLPAEDRRALAAVVERHQQVRRLVAGHMHRTIAGDLAGRGVAGGPEHLHAGAARPPLRGAPDRARARRVRGARAV